MNRNETIQRLEEVVGKWLVPLMLLTGAIVRITVWLQNRSLFLDEANLARNFCEKDFTAFFGPLEHGQYAPPFFSLIQKSVLLAFGNQEHALRLFPLLCGVLSIPLFYRLARHFISNNWVLLVTVWVFCFSEILLRYATEGKQYGCDVLIALGLINLVVRQLEKPLRPFIWTFIGAAAVWISMPTVFVLAGIGLLFAAQAWQKKEHVTLRAVVINAAVWCGSFAVYYLLLLRPTLGEQVLVESHSPWFLPLFPDSVVEWRQLRDLLLTFPYYTAGFTVLALTSGSAGILTGVWWCFKKQSPGVWLFIVPVLACLLASGLRQYSLMPRLMLWTFPLMLLVQGIGWQIWWAAGSRYVRPLWLLLWLAVAGLQTGWQYLYTPFVIEEIRPVLDEVASGFQPNDVVYVHAEAWPAIRYYLDCHTRKGRYAFRQQLIKGEWNSQPDADTIRKTTGLPRRIWLVYSHVGNDVTRQSMQADLEKIGRFARQTRKIEQTGAFGYLYVWE